MENYSENYTKAKPPLNSDHYEKEYRRVDVYHHFDSNVEELVLTLIKLIKDPIQIQIIEPGAGKAVKVVLEPQAPEINNQPITKQK
jgi:hypothetical protein